MAKKNGYGNSSIKIMRGIIKGEPNFDKCLPYIKFKDNSLSVDDVYIISVSNSGRIHAYKKDGTDMTNGFQQFSCIPALYPLIPRTSVAYSSPEILNRISSLIRTSLILDGHEVRSCKVKCNTTNSCILKYTVTVSTLRTNEIAITIDATSFRNIEDSDEFVDKISDLILNKLETYSNSGDVNNAKNEYFRCTFLPKLRDKAQERGVTLIDIKGNRAFVKVAVFSGSYSTAISQTQVLKDLKCIPADTFHKYLKNSDFSLSFGGDGESYIENKAIELCNEVRSTQFFLLLDDADQKKLKKRHPKAFQDAKVYQEKIEKVYSPLYFGCTQSTNEQKVYINSSVTMVKFELYHSTATFDAKTKASTFEWSDGAQADETRYNQCKSLRKMFEKLMNESESKIVPVPCSTFFGIMEEGHAEIEVCRHNYNQHLTIDFPGAENRSQWISDVYEPIEKAVMELIQQEQKVIEDRQRRRDEYRETYLAWGIYSAVYANEEYITASAIVDMLRGTNEKTTSLMVSIPEAGKFNCYSQEEIKSFINLLCQEGFLTQKRRRNSYTTYFVYKIGQTFSLSEEPELTKTKLEPLFEEPRKLTDVASSAVLHYYQGRKRLGLKDYMLMLRCLSDYILISESQAIAERFKGCPEEIKAMLELIFDKETDRNLKKAYKTILNGI